jgi:hypothetical protein
MVKLVVKNGHYKETMKLDLCLSIDIILGSIVQHNQEGICDHLERMRNFNSCNTSWFEEFVHYQIGIYNTILLSKHH